MCSELYFLSKISTKLILKAFCSCIQYLVFFLVPNYNMFMTSYCN